MNIFELCSHGFRFIDRHVADGRHCITFVTDNDCEHGLHVGFVKARKSTTCIGRLHL